jgi:hypothetical protein
MAPAQPMSSPKHKPNTAIAITIQYMIGVEDRE